MDCLIITDIQNDFCPGGALAIADGDQIIPTINKISAGFEKVVATQDWHPSGHVSFASTQGRHPFEVVVVDGQEQVLWPDHCVQGTKGADFHRKLDLAPVDLIIRKGNDPQIDSYSAFIENDKTTKTGLQYYLWGLGVKHIFICGLATDYCVYYSARDAATLGFRVTVIIDACRGIDVPEGNIDRILKDLRKDDVLIANHDAIRTGRSG